jgi:tyrosinase
VEDVAAPGGAIATAGMMVRIRKNANNLTTAERDRFLSALGRLNNQGNGLFQTFRDMHVAASSPEAHGAPGFLPWHRAFILDLERRLQGIDASVALPYWRFDQPAPNIFTMDFMGTTPAGKLNAVFGPANPLRFWKTDGVAGIQRAPGFDPIGGSPHDLRTEAQTLAIGGTYDSFRRLEGNPHGRAHTSFPAGWINDVPTAAKDPLFFLLHCNVDRLWAKWQWINRRFDSSVGEAYDSAGADRIGHHLPDTMWPWNGDTNSPRPSTAPGGGLAASPCVAAPGAQPTVASQLDFQGRVAANAQLGFDYDDVPYP